MAYAQLELVNNTTLKTRSRNLLTVLKMPDVKAATGDDSHIDSLRARDDQSRAK